MMLSALDSDRMRAFIDKVLREVSDNRIASAAAIDAGNRSMVRGKRTAWNESDFETASRARKLVLEQLAKEK